MSLNVTQSNQNLTLHVSQSNVKATLSVTQNINELHITAIQNNEITKLQPIVNTSSSDFIETDPIFQASEASLFAAGDKDKLDGIEAGAEVNVQSDWNQINPLDDSYIKNKPTIPTVLTNHSELTLDDGTNPHGTTKSDVGLSNVDNTSDIDKPISNATQTALDSKLNKDTTAGVERAYTINADGSQGTKATSEFKDVLDFANLASFPVTGETGKIYVALDTNKTYRWSGSVYVQIGGGEKQIFFTPGTKYDLNTISSCYSTNPDTGFASALINVSAGNMPTAMGIRWALPLFISEKNQKLKEVNIRITYASFTTLRLVIFTGLSVNGSTYRINNQIIHDQNYTLSGGNISLHKITSFTNDVTIPIGYDLCFFLIRVDGTTGTLSNFQISGYAS